jgi:DNA repair protein RecO (recombination protein O)
LSDLKTTEKSRHKEECFLLKKHSYGNGHLILHLMNAKGERLELVARGASQSKKRFGGGALEPFQKIELVWEEGINSKLGEAKEAVIINQNSGLRDSLEKLEIAYRGTQILDSFVLHGDSPSPEMAQLYELYLSLVSDVPLNAHLGLEKVYTYFLVRLLTIQGVMPKTNWSVHYLNLTDWNQFNQLHFEIFFLTEIEATIKDIAPKSLNFKW